MAKFFKNRAGQRYGKLIAIKVVGRCKHNGILRWLCKCDCGNERICNGDKLTNGTIISCGCTNKSPGNPSKDITNQRYGRLVALKLTTVRDKFDHILWLCRCDCGNEILVPAFSLYSNNTSSCGCLQTERLRERMSGENSPMKRPEVRAKLSGENSPAKRPEVREKHKGKNNHFYGKHHTEETKQKISRANKGLLLGEKNPRYGKCLSEERKHHQSVVMKGRFLGPNAPNWKGGISYEPYCPKFTKEFKNRVRLFFGNECVLCGKTKEENKQNLSVHHVNYDKMMCCNDNIVQFAALCVNCHTKTNHNRQYWEYVLNIIINEIYNGKSYYTKEEYEKL